MCAESLVAAVHVLLLWAVRRPQYVRSSDGHASDIMYTE